MQNLFVIKKCNTVHNHDIGPHLARHYPSNRHLNSIECQEALTLLEVGGNATLVRNYIEKKTGKFLTNQDICNMKMKFSSSCEESIVVLLKKFVEMDESNVACIVLDDDEKNIEIIFLQSQKQREWFDKFPELIILDGTYKINNAGMALYDILVEDGFGSSCVVAYCFVAQETKVSLVNFLQIFKKYNPRWKDVKVTLTDKDMTEIVSLNEELPQSTNLLCRFHMLKYFRTKIATYSCPKETKEQLMQLAKRMVYALSVDDMNRVVAEIESISPLFHEYLSKNWLSCKGSWCTFEQKELFTMCNSTTNKIEAHHRVLKLYLKSSASLYWNLEKLMIIMNDREEKLSHQDFIERMYTSIDTSELAPGVQPYLKHCTSFAAYKVIEEYKKACKKAYIFEENDDGFIVQGSAMTYVVSSTISSCTCSLFSAMMLPCCHLIFLLLQKEKDIFQPSLVGERWTKEYNCKQDIISNPTHNQEGAGITDFQLLKLTDVSPQKKTKLSRHQKYRKMILLGKELSDLSSDLSMRDYEVIVRVVKDVICKVKSGKFGEINFMHEAEILECDDAVHDLIDEVEEEEDMEPLPESLHNIIHYGEAGNDNTQPAADIVEAIPHISSANADNCLHLASSEMILPTDIAGVNYSEAQSSSQYSHMKTISTPNLEVLKNLRVDKQQKKRGRPSKKRACLSFKSYTKKRRTEEESQEQSQLHEQYPVLLKRFYELTEREQIRSKYTFSRYMNKNFVF